MPRPPATAMTEERVAQLVQVLFEDFDADGTDTVAALARDAHLEHETVRRLLRHPGGRNRSGPGFFIVAALARARRISLDDLAAKTMPESHGTQER